MPQQAKRSAPNPSPKRRKKNTGFRPLLLAAKLLAVLMMIGIITGCIVASVLTVYVLNTLDASDKVELENVKMSFTTILYALDEETDEYFELQRVQNNENRVWVDYSDIPQSVKDAAVAVEDKRFWQHSGVDLKRTVMAAVNYLNPFASDYFGGSTITQQVIKNVTDDKEFDVGRKVREIFRAINLEKNYSKDQILEVYLNTIALGNGQNGVQSAAKQTSATPGSSVRMPSQTVVCSRSRPVPQSALPTRSRRSVCSCRVKTVSSGAKPTALPRMR